MKQNKFKIYSIVFWIILWQLLSMFINQKLFLVSPFDVIKQLFILMSKGNYYLIIINSLIRLTKGFSLALISAVMAAIISLKNRFIKEMVSSFTQIIKTIPVASFIILVLLWVSSKNLSVVITFIMVFPIYFENINKGIENCDYRLLEMAEVFAISDFKKIRYIYFSEVLPYFKSASSLAVGLCFKAGIAAEVIGLPDSSIGEQLYNAKIYFDAANLFAWTFTIIILSVCFEKAFMFLINILINKIQLGE